MLPSAELAKVYSPAFAFMSAINACMVAGVFIEPISTIGEVAKREIGVKSASGS